MTYNNPRQLPISRPKLKYPLRRRRRNRIIASFMVLILILAVILTTNYMFATDKKVVASSDTVKQKVTTTAPATTTVSDVWRVVWGSPMAWGYQTVTNASLREIIKSPTAGNALEIQISNLYGNVPLNLESLNIAQVSSGANIIASTEVPLTFNGSTSVTIPVGQQLVSDPIQMSVSQFEVLAVSFYVVGSDLVTLHPCCSVGTASYFTPNNKPDVANSLQGSSFGYASSYPRFVDAMFLDQGPTQASSAGSIVVIGDSISDGYNSTTRWPDYLQLRIDQLPVVEQRAVIDEGITANALLSLPDDDSKKGGGPSGLSRVDNDALSLPGVSTVILLLGTNDLWFGATATQLIQGMQQFIQTVKAAGKQVIGITLLPRMSSVKELWTPLQQSYLEDVNNWMMTSNSFDYVVNMASVISDTYNGQCVPTSIFPPYNSGDNLHPSPAGDVAMANAVPAADLGYSSLPYVTPLVNVTPTVGCMGVEGIPSAYQATSQSPSH